MIVLIKVHPVELNNLEFVLINLNQIVCIGKKGNGTIIQFSNNSELECIETMNYFSKYSIIL